MQQQQHISREQKREFFIQTPALIDYLPLTPHEFRLYSHYVRVCGDDGQCWESVRTTAAHCRMGLGTVVRAREALEDIYQLIHTNKEMVEDGGTINIRIRDIWPINSQFLAMIRRYGMPSLEATEAWLLAQLKQEEVTCPFDLNEQSNNPDDYFKVEGCSTAEQLPADKTDEEGVPLWNTPFHEGTPCSTVEHPVPPARAAFHSGTPCSTVEPNKISIKQISSNQIQDKQIPLIAAAAVEPHTDSVQVSDFVSEDRVTSDLDPRAEIRANEIEGDRVHLTGRIDAQVSRRAAEQVCLDYMDLDEWRDRAEIVQSATARDLHNLLLWLRYASWATPRMMESGIQNVPGYIRSCYQTEWPPNTSERDVDTILEQIKRYEDEQGDASHRLPAPGVESWTEPASMTREEIEAHEQLALI